MKNTFQLVLAFVVFLAVGQAVAVGIGTGDYGMPVIIGLAALAMVLVATVGRHLPMDMTLLCLGVGGFYICGKGFAYLNAGMFLFAGELMLALGTLGYFWRVGKGEFSLVPRTPMAIALLLLGGYALIRLPIDFERFGIMAMRDSCMIYYTIFFFITYQLGQNESVQRLAPTILIAMAVPGAALDLLRLLQPAIFEQITFSVMVRGNPVFLNHGDAIHPAVFGLILFLSVKGTSGQGLRFPYMLLMFLIIAYMLAGGRGAIYISFGALMLFLLLARQFKPLLGVALGVAVLFIALLVLIDMNPTVGRTRVRQIEDQLNIILHPKEGLKVRTQDADTADWRYEWWKHITHDVNAQNPVFGLGFGADIATDFHRKYFKTGYVSEDIARTRGAHNALFTILARMGWLGVLLLGGVVAVQLYYFWRAMQAFGRGLLPATQMFFWGSNICSFVITFLQYAWEASYSAIPSWTCMGLSYAYLDRVLREEREQSVEEAAPTSRWRPGADSHSPRAEWTGSVGLWMAGLTVPTSSNHRRIASRMWRRPFTHHSTPAPLAAPVHCACGSRVRVSGAQREFREPGKAPAHVASASKNTVSPHGLVSRQKPHAPRQGKLQYRRTALRAFVPSRKLCAVAGG